MRLFVGIDIEPAIRERLARFVEGVRGFAPDARWVRPETFHVTLKFIGEVAEEKLGEVKGALGSVHGAATTIAFRGSGFFPTPKAARVFWIGIEADEHLAAVAAAIDLSSAALGIEAEKNPYRPHLTLARASGRTSGRPHQPAHGGDAKFTRLRKQLEKLVPPDFGTMTAREFFLYQSRLSPKGAEYTKIAQFQLKNT